MRPLPPPARLIYASDPPVTVTQKRPPLRKSFQYLRKICGDPATAPECVTEIAEIEKDVESQRAADALAVARMRCHIESDTCEERDT